MGETDMTDQFYLVENEVYKTQAERDVYVKDRTKAAQLLAINFFATLGVINSAQAHNHPFWYNKVVKLMKADKQVQLSNIKDDNSDLSVTLKISVDAGLWRNEATPREITRFLAKMKTAKPDKVDNAILMKWAADLKPDFPMILQDPIVRQAWLDWVQSAGVRDISAFAEAVRRKSRKLDLTGFFVSTLAAYGGLKAAPDHVVDGTAAQQSIGAAPADGADSSAVITQATNDSMGVTATAAPAAAKAVAKPKPIAKVNYDAELFKNSKELMDYWKQGGYAGFDLTRESIERMISHWWPNASPSRNVIDAFINGAIKYAKTVHNRLDVVSDGTPASIAASTALANELISDDAIISAFESPALSFSRNRKSVISALNPANLRALRYQILGIYGGSAGGSKEAYFKVVFRRMAQSIVRRNNTISLSYALPSIPDQDKATRIVATAALIAAHETTVSTTDLSDTRYSMERMNNAGTPDLVGYLRRFVATYIRFPTGAYTKLKLDCQADHPVVRAFDLSTDTEKAHFLQSLIDYIPSQFGDKTPQQIQKELFDKSLDDQFIFRATKAMYTSSIIEFLMRLSDTPTSRMKDDAEFRRSYGSLSYYLDSAIIDRAVSHYAEWVKNPANTSRYAAARQKLQAAADKLKSEIVTSVQTGAPDVLFSDQLREDLISAIQDMVNFVKFDDGDKSVKDGYATSEFDSHTDNMSSFVTASPSRQLTWPPFLKVTLRSVQQFLNTLPDMRKRGGLHVGDGSYRTVEVSIFEALEKGDELGVTVEDLGTLFNRMRDETDDTIKLFKSNKPLTDTITSLYRQTCDSVVEFVKQADGSYIVSARPYRANNVLSSGSARALRFVRPWFDHSDMLARGVAYGGRTTTADADMHVWLRKVDDVEAVIKIAAGITSDEAKDFVAAIKAPAEIAATMRVLTDINNASDDDINEWILDQLNVRGYHQRNTVSGTQLFNRTIIIERMTPETRNKVLKATLIHPDLQNVAATLQLNTLAAIDDSAMLKEVLQSPTGKKILSVDWGALPARSEYDKTIKLDAMTKLDQLLVQLDDDDKATEFFMESISRSTFDVMRGSVVGIAQIKKDIANSPVKTFQNDFNIKAVLKLNGINMHVIARSLGIRLKPSETRMDHLRRIKAAAGDAVLKPPLLGDELTAEEIKVLNKRNMANHYAARHGYTFPVITKAWKMTPENVADFDEFFRNKPHGGKVTPAFHGTGGVAANMISRYGFTIIPERASVAGVNIAGRMLGNGIYFAPNVDKASQYVSNNGFRAGGGRGVQGYMFEMEANLGERNTDYRSAGLGGDGIRSAEYAVFSPEKQLKMVHLYLVEITPLDEAKTLLKEGAHKFSNFLIESNVDTTDAKYNTYTFSTETIPLIGADGEIEFVKREDAAKDKRLAHAFIEDDLRLTVSFPGEEEVQAIIVDEHDIDLRAYQQWIKDLRK